AETLRLHRGLAVERHRRGLLDLARRLSMSARRCPPPPALEAWLDARRPLPVRVAFLAPRYANEPARLALALLAADLEAASRAARGRATEALRPRDGRGRARGERGNMAPLSTHRSYAKRVRSRAARGLRHLDDARSGGCPRCAPARPLGRRGLESLDRAPLRNARRPRSRARDHGGAPGPARLPGAPQIRVAQRRLGRSSDGDDRLFRQQQGRRISRGGLVALSGPGGRRARVLRTGRSAHALPRPR